MDFNTPLTRSAMKLPVLAQELANVITAFSPGNAIVITVLPTCAKEESELEPFDDEVAIRKAFLGAGFIVQQPVRMNLEWSATAGGRVQLGDWWVDLRLMFLGDPSAVLGPLLGHKDKPGNFFRVGSELCRTRWVPGPTPVVEIKELVEPPTEGPPRQEKRFSKEDRAAQRGHEFTANILIALLQRSQCQKSGTEPWFTPHDETIVLDPFPFVGDRALATMAVNKRLGALDAIPHQDHS